VSFRTVVIKNRAKIETRLNWLVIRAEEEKWINLAEIGVLIVESNACAITTQALSKLLQHNTNVVFCDEKHQPQGHLSGIYANHSTSGFVIRQSNWTDEQKGRVWQEVIKQKIEWQSKVLDAMFKMDSAELLRSYIPEVESGDITNREGHAAKVYFNALFGQDFGRRDVNETNSALNYGYAIILSNVCRDIVASGYCTQLGVHHINQYNQFNLASDLMEPFRPLVDMFLLDNIMSIKEDDEERPKNDFKQKMSKILSSRVKIQNKEHYLDNAIQIYIRAVLKAVDEPDTEMPVIQNYILENREI